MILAAGGGTETVLFSLSVLVGIAGALGVAYTIFRSSAEQRLREVDQQIINNQNVLIAQQEGEASRLRTDLANEKNRAEIYRESLTQRAAVEHLAEVVAREESARREEHSTQIMLLKDVISQLKHNRGSIQ